MGCERMIPHSNKWRKWKVKCLKPATEVDKNGINLCFKCLKTLEAASNRLSDSRFY